MATPNAQSVTLREALEPFAKLFQALQSKHVGPMPTTFEAIINTEDVRRAAYAFADLSQPLAPEQHSGEAVAERLVPVEPTSAMSKAAADAWLDCGSKLILNKASAALKAGINAARSK